MQHAHISAQLRALHGTVLEVVAAMNRPQQDEVLIRAAGIRLDRALFPLLVGIGRLQPVGVVDLADRVGRDYTTVSRQVAKLASLGLVARRPSDADRRVRQATITAEGAAMIAAIDRARDRIGHAIFRDWRGEDIDALVALMRRFADALAELPAEAPAR
ncbi:MarR family winged helix-turn-helix transcriptional regulator [Rhizosaccharibacter radicis]|uniref:MarR family transcriptional regulator n=1 Tax=Rhizosaccharibacter radicis TaxID=2782605 RepID=A0ABT1VTP3_9PROT|nr:MarR family transcriptional regulator [Acetobacteraceae bacterium KSS12]